MAFMPYEEKENKRSYLNNEIDPWLHLHTINVFSDSNSHGALFSVVLLVAFY